jgi:sorbitol/mannitol transport system substrate-binding protein
MKRFVKAGLVVALTAAGLAHAATELVIATVNNGHMIEMQKLTPIFEKANPDIKLKWVVLEENVLRQRLTTDIATKGGQFDVLTIGMYEASLWGAKGWLKEMDNLPASYALDDVFPSVRDGLSVDGKLFALPFYAESSITYYRKDLFKAAGLTMPERPTWTQISEFAAESPTEKTPTTVHVPLPNDSSLPIFAVGYRFAIASPTITCRSPGL